MKSANSGAPSPTKNNSNAKQEDKYSHRLYQSHQQNINGKGKKENLVKSNFRLPIFISRNIASNFIMSLQHISVMYPLSPSMEFDLQDDEKEDDDIINKKSIGSTKTRLHTSAYKEKSGHITASS